MRRAAASCYIPLCAVICAFSSTLFFYNNHNELALVGQRQDGQGERYKYQIILSQWHFHNLFHFVEFHFLSPIFLKLINRHDSLGQLNLIIENKLDIYFAFHIQTIIYIRVNGMAGGETRSLKSAVLQMIFLVNKNEKEFSNLYFGSSSHYTFISFVLLK